MRTASQIAAPPEDALYRADLRAIVELVDHGARVLDLGCGDGGLLVLLAREKGVTGVGVELDPELVHKCITRGLSVYNADIDEGLADHPDDSFDYVIMSKTLQETRRPDFAIREMLRVGRRGIISFANFAHWKARYALAIRGRAPVNEALPYEWYESPNRHFLSIKDFREFCRKDAIRIEKAVYLAGARRIRFLPNLIADVAVFLISKPGS